MAFRLTAQIVRTVAGDPNPTSTPVCEESFKRICTSVDCDIVSMDLTQQLAYRLNQKHVEAAAKRGLVFEIVYSKLFLDATIRRNVFTNARALCRALRGKGVIISSGARKPLDLRNPHDAMNLAHLFGLKMPEAKRAIDGTCIDLLGRLARKKFVHRGFMLVRDAEPASEEDEGVRDAKRVRIA